MPQDALDQVPGGGPQVPQDGFDATVVTMHDGDQAPDQAVANGQALDQVAVPDQVAVRMPEHIIIGTSKAHENNRADPYEKRQVDGETIYVCTKGSEWARTNERLVLRCEQNWWSYLDCL